MVSVYLNLRQNASIHCTLLSLKHGQKLGCSNNDNAGIPGEKSKVIKKLIGPRFLNHKKG
jgi:hypothetical protein